jgi:DNA polymerase V
METSARVYRTYLRYMAPEDIHVYSIDEVLLDLTPYLKSYGCSARQLIREMIRAVLKETGITATAGIGTNLYLCKVAMDIVAKHMEPDGDGVRIASLTEQSYRETLWDHCPLTDFWRIGPGITRKLQRYGMYTLGAVARMSLQDPDLLYHLFGVNAELLIDHAWGWEPCTLQDIKTYRPRSSSLGAGQVLQHPYPADKARLIVWEMADLLALDLVKKGLVTDQLVLTLGYDRSNLEDPWRRRSYQGRVVQDHYGRPVPVHGHGSLNLPGGYTASGTAIRQAALDLFDRVCNPLLLVRKVTLTAEHVVPPEAVPVRGREADLFAGMAEQGKEDQEDSLQQTILDIQARYGKNALLRGSNLLQGAMTRERNGQVGGHRA